MRFTLKAKTHSLRGKIKLPGSKSISNRALIINALAARSFEIQNLSEADDTMVLKKALERNDLITDVGPAGTAMRFLTAYYAITPGVHVLTGSERMKQRPISILVEALRKLGARITYLEKDGYPPIHIEGRRLNGGTIDIDGNVSSQFITALMLIGPTLPQPLTININGNPLSRPYIIMTKTLMERCGAQVGLEENVITINPGRYRSHQFDVERDWSSAAFWMSFAALSRKADLLLEGLSENSIQGDIECIEVFNALGVESKFVDGDLKISKKAIDSQRDLINFRNHPDLVQPAAIAAAALGLDLKLAGLDNLRLKESDRIQALQMELAKAGFKTSVEDHTLHLIGSAKSSIKPEHFAAHDDHRMAMSLASLAMVIPEIVIHDPMVVSKSYPSFWNQVEKFVDVRPGR